jgi:hypothetical protein
MNVSAVIGPTPDTCRNRAVFLCDPLQILVALPNLFRQSHAASRCPHDFTSPRAVLIACVRSSISWRLMAEELGYADASSIRYRSLHRNSVPIGFIR